MIILDGGNIYVSNLGIGFEETDHSEPSIDDYGLDSMTRTYIGGNSALNAFLATWINPITGVPLLTPDYEYAGMVATGRPAITRGRAWSEVQVKFEGKISNTPPLVRIINKWTDGIVQVSGVTATSPPENGTAMADYRAMETTYEYCASSLPVSSPYSSVLGGLIQISSIATGSDGIINTATPHGLIAGDNFILTGVTGSVPNLNGFNTVKTVTDTDTFTIETNVTTGASNGSLSPVTSAGQGAYIVALRGSVLVSGVYYPIAIVDSTSFVVVQRLKSAEREQVGVWYKCKDTWGYELAQDSTVTPP